MLKAYVLLMGIIWAQIGLRPISPSISGLAGILLNPWAGGLQAPQFSRVDINGDGQEELFVYDRADDRILLFRWVGGEWRYLPQADTLFPTSLLSAWVLLRDADGDGDKDLFTNLNSNIRVIRNIAPPNSPPQWQLWFNPLPSEYYTYSTPLYSGSVDIPALVDVDSDGDLDILVYEVLGALIEWHRNWAKELLGRSDTLVMKLQSACWGHVYELYDYNTNQFSFQPYTCGPGQRGRESWTESALRIHHAGGSLQVIDLNGDGLKDLIVGDDGPPYLIAGLNQGVPDSAHIPTTTAISPYPPSNPLYLPSFPATYFEDVTGDGKPDLICANNSPLAGRDTWSIWLYRNIHRADSPAWAAPVVGWLQNTMLDVGTAAHPTLADLNRDGHPDLLLTCESFYTDAGRKTRAFLLWGSATGFTLADTNWLNLSQYTLLNPIFAMGDIDRNGRTDLLMGTSTGALWHWEENQAGQADFTLITQNFAGINGPPFAAPLLYDYDGDADLDLILGGRNGRLSLYRQDAGGTFTPLTDFLGEIEVRDTISTLLGFARPALVDIDRNGTPELLVGNLTGFLWVYAPLWQQPTTPWPKIAELPYREGKRASPTAWQTPDSTLLLVGNLRGGIQAYTLTSGGSSTLLPPSPSAKPYSLHSLPTGLHIKATPPLQLTVYTLQGQILYQESHSSGETFLPLPPGLYLIHLSTSSYTYGEKVVILP